MFVVGCHSDGMMETLLGNVTTNDVVVSSLVYVNLTSLQTYLTVMLEITTVCLLLSLTVSLSVCLSIYLSALLSTLLDIHMYINCHVMLCLI